MSRHGGRFAQFWLQNHLGILPSSVGFPPSLSDQKIEGLLLPVIRKPSESQHGVGSWLGADEALSTLWLRVTQRGALWILLRTCCVTFLPQSILREATGQFQKVYCRYMSYLGTLWIRFGMRKGSFFGLIGTLLWLNGEIPFVLLSGFNWSHSLSFPSLTGLTTPTQSFYLPVLRREDTPCCLWPRSASRL